MFVLTVLWCRFCTGRALLPSGALGVLSEPCISRRSWYNWKETQISFSIGSYWGKSGRTKGPPLHGLCGATQGWQWTLTPPPCRTLHMFDMHLCKLIKLTKYCFLIMHRAEYWPQFHRDPTSAQIDEQFYNCIYAISLYFQSAFDKKDWRKKKASKHTHIYI